MRITQQEFKDVQRLVRTLCGLVLTDDKSYLVTTRLESVVRGYGCATFAEYFGRLQQTHARQMRDELVEALTTGETSFNRDGHPFEEFRRQILPWLAESVLHRRDRRQSVPMARLWSAGCSTGQEPYSLAIAIREFLQANPHLDLRSEDFPILATDVSNRSLQVAKAGKYTERELDRGLARDLQVRYFETDGEYRVAQPTLRRMIEFRQLNFIDPLIAIGPFDVIFCRNVLIYFDTETRQRLCERFSQVLRPQGLLVLGAAESLYGLTVPLVQSQRGTTMVYQKMTE